MRLRAVGAYYGEAIALGIATLLAAVVAWATWFDTVARFLGDWLVGPLRILNGLPGALGVAGIVLTLWLYLLGRPRRGIAWSEDSTVIADLTDLPFDIFISYEGYSLSHLVLSRIVVWNSGNETIDSEALDTEEPVKIRPPEGGIVVAAVVRVPTTGTSIAFEIAPDRHAAVLRTNYLNAGAGLFAEIYHTGGIDKGDPDWRPLRVQGLVRGVDKIRYRPVIRTRWLPFPTPTSLDDRIPPLWRWRLTIAIEAIAAFALLFFNLPQLVADVVNMSPADPWSWVFITLRTALCLLGVYALWSAFRVTWFRVPKGLEAFHGVPGKGEPTSFIGTATD